MTNKFNKPHKEHYREKMKIYIIQMYSNTFPSKLVKLVTKYKYSHIGICLDKECNLIYSFGRKSLNNFLNGGFVIEPKTGEFFKKFNQTTCRIYELEVDTNQYMGIKAKLDYMEQNEKAYKYDFWGTFLRLFNIPISFKNRYVCSQFVAELLEEFNIHKFEKNTCFIKPRDFEKIEGIKEIYSGKYLSYTN